MRTTFTTLTGALLLAVSGGAFAASSVDLSVKGMITPSACTPTLANGGEVDLGKISAKDLRPAQHTYLPRQNLQMTVNCDAATLIAIAAKDNRENTESSMDYYNFGIGLINGSEKLGYVTISPSNSIADGATVRSVGSRDGGVTWERESSFTDDGLTAFADLTTTTPLPIQALTTDLQVGAVIAPAQNLTLNEEQPIDGSVTLTVRYL
ncbi:DUF1120 domain-containing protein [Pseudomonas sp. MPB26]|uniref:DUF1120 domain-containing protein n=1 Tax=Pseudomonas sp. MPB26 TaxID=3388491 RepID=UPI003984798A